MSANNGLSLNTSTAGIYTDFNGLARLRGQAAEQTPEARKEVAQQFEALFIQTMLKAMRDASQLSESTDGDQTRFYQDMFDKQIALDLASGQGIGLAAAIEQQLGGPTEAAAGRKTFADDVERNWKPDSPQAFINDLWPLARDAAAGLGVAPEVLVAQSALETNWGQNMIKDRHGLNSLNLFAIKADARWDGDSATVSTLEYRDGVAQAERASFRSYASRSDSLNDYVDFLKTNPRYQPALDNVADAGNYLNALQSAGYATDPAYANKILNILSRDSFVETVAPLKAADNIASRDFSF